jgi:hypothetical protein
MAVAAAEATVEGKHNRLSRPVDVKKGIQSF